jgi:hypothetical protein
VPPQFSLQPLNVVFGVRGVRDMAKTSDSPSLADAVR